MHFDLILNNPPSQTGVRGGGEGGRERLGCGYGRGTWLSLLGASGFVPRPRLREGPQAPASGVDLGEAVPGGPTLCLGMAQGCVGWALPFFL